MKYRIVQLNNGSYAIQSKKSFFSEWMDIWGPHYKELFEAKNFLKGLLDQKQLDKDFKKGLEIKKVIEVIKE